MLQDEGQARNEEDKANDERALVLWNAAKAAVLEKKNTSSARPPNFPPDVYYDVAFFTWGSPYHDQPDGISHLLKINYDPAICPTTEDVVKIQDWLATDDVKQYLDLKEWAKEEWVHLAAVQKRRDLSKVHSFASYPEWVLNLMERIFQFTTRGIRSRDEK